MGLDRRWFGDRVRDLPFFLSHRCAHLPFCDEFLLARLCHSDRVIDNLLYPARIACLLNKKSGDKLIAAFLDLILTRPFYRTTCAPSNYP